MSQENPQPLAPFTWHAHPARERTGPAVLGLLIVAALAAAVWTMVHSITGAVVSAIVVVAALNRFYFRSRFEIDSTGITARFLLGTQRLRWSETRRFVVDDHGGYLSSRSKRSRLDAWQGVHILFGLQRAAVIERIQAHLGEGS